jgi:hypothetical protein
MVLEYGLMLNFAAGWFGEVGLGRKNAPANGQRMI